MTAKRPTARERSGKGKPSAAKMSTTVKLRPPGEDRHHEITINLMGFTLAERDRAKRALAQFTDPDLVDVMAVNAWIVWLRDHPDTPLSDWVEGVTFGDMLGVDWDEAAAMPWTTPEEFSPEA